MRFIGIEEKAGFEIKKFQLGKQIIAITTDSFDTTILHINCSKIYTDTRRWAGKLNYLRCDLCEKFFNIKEIKIITFISSMRDIG